MAGGGRGENVGPWVPWSWRGSVLVPEKVACKRWWPVEWRRLRAAVTVCRLGSMMVVACDACAELLGVRRCGGMCSRGLRGGRDVKVVVNGWAERAREVACRLSECAFSGVWKGGDRGPRRLRLMRSTIAAVERGK